MNKRTKIILALLIPRLLISLLVPPAAGGFLFCMYDLGMAGSWLPRYILGSFIWGGIQTIGYTAMMEYIGWQWLRKSNVPKKLCYVLIGSFAGGIAGFSVDLWYGGDFQWDYSFPALVTGLIVGMTVTSIKMKLHLLQKAKVPSTSP